jgi:hypothetical protein
MAVYRRHRQHVWVDHSIGHLERILEARGLYQRLDTPPCVCFVDLTGYTRLTEEQGDAAAAELAGRLAALVEGIGLQPRRTRTSRVMMPVTTKVNRPGIPGGSAAPLIPSTAPSATKRGADSANARG